MIYIGIDPDLHRTGVFVISEKDGEIIAMSPKCLKVAGDLKAEDAAVAMARRLRTVFDDLAVTAELAGGAVVAVEGQEVSYTARSGKNPRSVLQLAWVSGAAVAAALSLPPSNRQRIYLWPPAKWKGSVPKQIHQARIYKQLGWEAKKVGKPDTGYCQPVGDDVKDLEKKCDIKPGDWKHVGDAMGLALKAMEVYKRESARQEFFNGPARN